MYGIFIGNHLEENNVGYIEHCCFWMPFVKYDGSVIT